MKQQWIARLAVASVAAGFGLVACGDDDTQTGPGSHEAGQTSGGNGSDQAGGSSTPHTNGGSEQNVDMGGAGGVPAQGDGGTGQAGLGQGGVAEGGAGDVSSGGASGGDGGGGGAGGDANAKVCTVKQYGDLGEVAGSALENQPDPLILTLGVELQTDFPEDQLSLELYSGSGVFKDGVKTGTYQLKGTELNYSTCGLCIRFFEQRDAQGVAKAVYFPTGGTVALTSVKGKLTGLLSNITWQEVTIAPQTYVSTPVPNGCTTGIQSMSFDETITN